jgi:phage terminase large subunit
MNIESKIETRIALDRFVPRDYQLPICNAFEKKGYKKLAIVLPRRAGKDIVALNLLIRAAFKRIGTYYYLLPDAVQARRVMFDGKTNNGQRIIDFIPQELIKSINIQQMKITLVNDSIIQFVGSERYDSLRGTNPVGCVFSEAAYSHPQAYPTLSSILLANGGFVIFISTPFGENHFYKLFEIAKANPDEWFSYFLTARETGHITHEQIEREILTGVISPDMAEQEYYCSFSIGAIGAYYAKYLNRMELNNQIGTIDWEPNFPVHSSWDLGVRDQTCILLFQCIGRQINIIDMYQNSDVGLEHYINVLQSKPYTWGKHIAPHDIKVREFTSGGISRIDKAAQLGFKFVIAPNLTVIDGIESVRTTLPRIYIDNQRCRPLIEALRNYRKEYDAATKMYRQKPLHDMSSHICDSLRMLATYLPNLQTKSTTPEELDRRYQEAMYGQSLPRFFQDDHQGYY